MKNLSKVAGVTILGIAMLGASASAKDCVKIIGTESGIPNITFDPAFVNTNDDSYGQNAVFNRFINVDQELQPVPELAESWSQSDDGKSWTFIIRKGVKFQNGKDLKAEDVVYTFQRLIDPAVASPGGKLLTFLKADGIKALDDYRVQFTTEQPIAELPTALAIKYSMIVPKGATADELKTKPVGTGPFTVETFSPTETRRILRRNPNYWKTGLPKAECLEISVLTEEVTRVASIKSGAADLLLNAGPASVPVLQNDPSVKLLTAPAGQYYTLSMWTDAKPFDDVRVRQALKAVVDRQGMVDSILLGHGEPGNDAPIPPTWPTAFRHDIKPRDIEKAKQLLADAGYPNGIDIELNTAEGGPGMVNMAQAYQQMAAPAGVRVNLINNPADTYWDVIWMKRPFFTSSWVGRPMAEALSYTFSADAKYNEGRWKDLEFNDLLNKARIEPDKAKRDQLYVKAQEMLSDRGGIIIPFFLRDTTVLRADCSGFTPHTQNNNFNFEDLTCKGKEAE